MEIKRNTTRDTPIKPVAISKAVSQFDSFPSSALVSIRTYCAVVDRSHASAYRDIKAGRLTIIKIGNSSRLNVGQIRKLISGVA